MIKSAIRFLTLFACSVALAMTPMHTSVKAAPNNSAEIEKNKKRIQNSSQRSQIFRFGVASSDERGSRSETRRRGRYVRLDNLQLFPSPLAGEGGADSPRRMRGHFLRRDPSPGSHHTMLATLSRKGRGCSGAGGKSLA